MKGIFSNVKKRVGNREVEAIPAGFDISGSPLSSSTHRDIVIPKRERSNSFGNGGKRSFGANTKADPRMRDLPALKDTPAGKRDALFQLKLQLCCVIFDHTDPDADKNGMETKWHTLIELKDYVNTPQGQKQMFSEANMPEIINMVQANICRALPPLTESYDPDEDEPVLEPAWPHLQVVYEFFLRFVVSAEVSAKAAKRHIDQSLCLWLIELFESEDPRERDYLKTILHRIYGKVMHHRGFIRRAIGNAFHRFVFETERHAGVAEMLEILGSIINGFAKPLKHEHVVFLRRALLPLHKPRAVKQYHQHLSYCVVQYVEKDADTVIPVVLALCRWWPWSSCAKQLLFLNELEEVLEVCSGAVTGTPCGAAVLREAMMPLATLLARCVGSTHFQVAERALFFWNNEQLVGPGGALSMANAGALLPLLLGPVRRHADGHWNAVVEGLASNVLKMFMDHDPVLFDRCSQDLLREEAETARQRLEADQRWAALERQVQATRATRLRD
ncbi:protein phosphatase 2A regulatory B subunit [Tribonema minus]|uniref:Serine/threonine protein phosphatase 2A regulatory subunit n=1 Tax=Tribonema minus TaxID=303371 RepID=A0A835ZI01_9STRA|nr:protein phosphatase 2A regulatory B subunit [Tribonema minus]